MSKSTSKINIPEARAAMDKFKMEAANEVGVDLKQGYNGHLTSREAGSVGGQMVKKMIEGLREQDQVRFRFSIPGNQRTKSKAAFWAALLFSVLRRKIIRAHAAQPLRSAPSQRWYSNSRLYIRTRSPSCTPISSMR